MMARPITKTESGVEPALLDEIVRRVVEVARPERIILFGSAARGDSGPDSDIDLLVVKSDIEDRGRLTEDIHLRFFGLPVSVDVLVVTPEEVERRSFHTTLEWHRRMASLFSMAVAGARDIPSPGGARRKGKLRLVGPVAGAVKI
jgi:hypothetical protein